MSQRVFTITEALATPLLAKRVRQARQVPLCPRAEIRGIGYGRSPSEQVESERLFDVQLAPGVFAVVFHPCENHSPLR